MSSCPAVSRSIFLFLQCTVSVTDSSGSLMCGLKALLILSMVGAGSVVDVSSVTNAASFLRRKFVQLFPLVSLCNCSTKFFNASFGIDL